MGKDTEKSKKGFRERISSLREKAAVKIDINRLNACSVLLNFILGHNDRSIKRGLMKVKTIGSPNFSQIKALTDESTPAGKDFMKLVESKKTTLKSEMNDFLNAVKALCDLESPTSKVLSNVQNKFNSLYNKTKQAKLGDPFSYGITDRKLWEKAKSHLNSYIDAEILKINAASEVDHAKSAATEDHKPESTTSEVSTEPTAAANSSVRHRDGVNNMRVDPNLAGNRPNAASEADTKPAAPGRINPDRMKALKDKMSGASASADSGTPQPTTPDPAPVTPPSNIPAPPPAPGDPSAPPPPPPPVPAAVRDTAKGYELKKGKPKEVNPPTQPPVTSQKVPVVIKHFKSDDARFKRIQEIIKGGEESNLTPEELDKVGLKLSSEEDKVKEYVKILEREGINTKFKIEYQPLRKRYAALKKGEGGDLTSEETKRVEEELSKKDKKPLFVKMLAKELAGEYFSASDKELINKHYDDDKLKKSKSKTTNQKVDFENLFKKSKKGQIKENYWPIFLNDAHTIDDLIDAYKEWREIITNDEYFTLNVKLSRKLPISENEQKTYDDYNASANDKCFTFSNRVKNAVSNGNEIYDVLSGKKVATKTVKPKATPGATPVKDNVSWLDKYEWMKPYLDSKQFEIDLKYVLNSEQLRREGTESIQKIKSDIKEFNETYEDRKKAAENERDSYEPNSRKATEAKIVVSSLENSKKDYDTMSSNIDEQERKYALVFDKDINLVSAQMTLNANGTLKEALKKLVEAAEQAKRKENQPKITLQESLKNVSEGKFERVTDGFNKKSLMKKDLPK